MKIYTRGGDDGTTGLFRGGRVGKDDAAPEAYGAVDEAVAALGIVRAEAARLTNNPSDGRASEAESSLPAEILDVQRELFVVGAELATAPDKRSALQEGISLVHQAMVDRLEAAIDDVVERHGMPTEFVVPGGSPVAAALDLARTVVRKAERRSVTYARAGGLEGSLVVPYLNRLADYLYMLARAAESEWVPTRPKESP